MSDDLDARRRHKKALRKIVEPEARVVYWSEYTLPGETRLHAQWRYHRERGIIPTPDTFPAYLRSIFDGAGEAGLTWERFLREMYEYAEEKGYTGSWEDFLAEAGEPVT